MQRATNCQASLSSGTRFAVVTLLAAILLSTIKPASAEEPAKELDETAGKAKFLIESMLKEREKTTSGIVHLRGNQFIRGNDPPPEQPIRGMYAFDHAHGLLRFDNSKHMIVRSLTPDKLAAAGGKLKVASALTEAEPCNAILRYVRNADYSASWSKMSRNTQDSMSLRRADAEMGGALASMHHMIDLRASGVMTYFDFDSGDFERGKTVKDYCDALLKLPVAQVTERDGLAVITFRPEHRELRLTIDTARQFSPVEFVCKWFKSPGTTFDVTQSSRVKWASVQGVRVPKSFSIEFDMPEGTEYSLCRFSYLWHTVNKPVARQYFDYKSLPNIPDGTNVVEMRKGKPFRIGVWQAEGVVGPEDKFDEVAPDADDPKAKSSTAIDIQNSVEGERAGQERDDNELKMKFVWCPPGRFVMGSPPEERDQLKGEDQVEVVLTKGFWLGKYEVSQSQWAKLKSPALWRGQRLIEEGDDFPATYLSWANAVAFCEKLTKLERAAGRLPDDWQYILPTEAQWEYACRAGTTTRFSFGDDESLLDDHAWNVKNATRAGEPYAHVVGRKKPNPFGFHDMHGNVAEWCLDGWQEKLPGGTDPLTPAKDELRVIRGGNWLYPALLCRSAFRDSHHSLSRDDFSGDLGFRVVLCRIEKR